MRLGLTAKVVIKSITTKTKLGVTFEEVVVRILSEEQRRQRDAEQRKRDKAKKVSKKTNQGARNK